MRVRRVTAPRAMSSPHRHAIRLGNPARATTIEARQRHRHSRPSALTPNHTAGFAAVRPWRTVHHRPPKNSPPSDHADSERCNDGPDIAHSSSSCHAGWHAVPSYPVPRIRARRRTSRPTSNASVQACVPGCRLSSHRPSQAPNSVGRQTDQPMSPNIPRPDQTCVPAPQDLQLAVSPARRRRRMKFWFVDCRVESGSGTLQLGEPAHQPAFQMCQCRAGRFLLLAQVQKLLLNGLAQVTQVRSGDRVAYADHDLRPGLDQYPRIYREMNFARVRSNSSTGLARAPPRNPAGEGGARKSPPESSRRFG